MRTPEVAEDEVTVLGRRARLEGDLVAHGSLRIDGDFKGKIAAEGDVTLSAPSQVEADIQAQNVTAAGNFKGTIVARNRAELAGGGRVEGTITSKMLLIEEGAWFHGQSIMEESGKRSPGPAGSEEAR